MRLIDADALLCDIIERYCKDCDKRKGVKNGKRRIIYEIGDAPCRACGIDDMAGEIEDAPTADVVERKRGKWIPSFDRWGDIVTTVDGYTCSECGSFNTDKDNFCPNCGAEMKGEEE